MYRYYLIFKHSGGDDYRYIQRERPLDSEEAIREMHLLLEEEVGRRVVIVDWKRID